VIHVRLPALRERPEDIIPLAHSFLRIAAERVGRPDVTSFAPGVLDHLASISWSGNVRALENAIERAVVLAEEHRVEMSGLPEELQPVARLVSIVPAALPSASEPAAPPAYIASGCNDDGVSGQQSLRSAVEAFENDLIMRALSKTSFNKQRAANILGLKRTTLIEMMKRKGLER